MQHAELVQITAGVVFVLLLALVLSRRKRKG
jgi:LPXTG-motif cell wall-anchored protein